MNKISTTISGILVIPVLLVFSCATVMTGGVQSIPVITEPSAADVTIYDSNNILLFQGYTPCNITMEKKKLINSRLIISKEGYKNIEIKIGKKIDTCFWGNVCIGIIPGVIDIINGNWMTTDIGGVLAKLEEVRIVYNRRNGSCYIFSNNSNDNSLFVLDIEKNDHEYTINIEVMQKSLN